MGSIETLIDHENHLSIHTVKGKVSGEEIALKIEAYHSGEPERFAIWDFSEADLTQLTTDDLRSILSVSKISAGQRKGGKTALVVPHDYTYGLGRMWEAFTEFENLPVVNRAFRSLEEAKAWLGIKG